MYGFVTTATHHLTKTIELSRIHLFNIITQYNAVFPKEESMKSSRQLLLPESAIFHSWLNKNVRISSVLYRI